MKGPQTLTRAAGHTSGWTSAIFSVIVERGSGIRGIPPRPISVRPYKKKQMFARYTIIVKLYKLKFKIFEKKKCFSLNNVNVFYIGIVRIWFGLVQVECLPYYAENGYKS